MCRLSWKPDTCVSKTTNLFSAHGLKALLVAKFVPGLSTLAPPLAGITLVPFASFVIYDGIGTVIWALVPLIVGAYLQKSLVALQARVQTLEAALPWVCGFLIIAVLVWRFVNRSNYLKALRGNLRSGISTEALKLLLDRGEDVVVLDVRDEISAKANPVALPKARWIPSGALTERLGELPLEKPIFVYCDCPEDQSAMAMVEVLRQHGAKQARPLHGGLDAWIAKGFGTAELAMAAA
jgi:rhodanese-related sulfurtransferase